MNSTKSHETGSSCLREVYNNVAARLGDGFSAVLHPTGTHVNNKVKGKQKELQKENVPTNLLD